MKTHQSVSKVALPLAWITGFILAMLPFHAFLTVWLSSGLGHYTLLRLWKEFLITILLIGAVYLLVKNRPLFKVMAGSWLFRLMGLYALLLLLSGGLAYFGNSVAGKALAYGELLDLRFLVFFCIVWVIAANSPVLYQNWRRLLLLPSLIVIIFGLVQYWLLPYDFLRHFGYGPNTISPYETINHNLKYLRIESTLRGANPLGAYLLLIVTALTTLIVRAKARRVSKSIFLAAALVALTLTFSRSAWLGTLLSVGVVLWLSLKSDQARRTSLIVAGLVIFTAAIVGIGLRQNTRLQDAVLHTDNQSTAQASSNQGHSVAFKSGVSDIVHRPWGDGVGTAGPASVYNKQPARIAENYYLQIGQEAGLVGMGLFIAINVMVGWQLYKKRGDSLAVVLLASLVGLGFVNLLSHAWADDTLAYIWWGLAGICLAPAILTGRPKAKYGKTENIA
ncbi:MAG TPA: O-antigen ligase family protein [Candidatus Binatia bacterium]|nr:O-antigen ligase family protein [Candidatus Binatia bacterium]